MKKSYNTIIAYADNTTRFITDEGKNLSFNQVVLLARIEMENNRNILDIIVSRGRKSIELTQSYNPITGMWEIRKI